MKIVIISIVLLFTIGVGLIFYQFGLKDHTIEEDPKVNEILHSEYEILLPANGAEIIRNELEPRDLELVEDEVRQEQLEQQQATTNMPTHSAEEVKGKYRQSFESLEVQANNKLNNLIARAYDEYTEKKNNGESISYSYFYSKYKNALDALEAQTDKAFLTIYDTLINDLTSLGYDPAKATVFKEEYERTKNSQKHVLLQRIMEHF